jgi:hypothetical protein
MYRLPSASCQLWDYTVFFTVLVVFLLYPSLSARTLRLYECSIYGDLLLLAADTRLDCRSRELWFAQKVGLVVIGVFVVGVPLSFYAVLYYAASQRQDVTGMLEKLDEARAEMDRRYQRRLGILYTKYKSDCWWWEVFDLIRKLLLTSVIVFIDAGSVLQVNVSPLSLRSSASSL